MGCNTLRADNVKKPLAGFAVLCELCEKVIRSRKERYVSAKLAKNRKARGFGAVSEEDARTGSKCFNLIKPTVTELHIPFLHRATC
jgi:hypothetical protein